jgi:hypothetical protein
MRLPPTNTVPFNAVPAQPRVVTPGVSAGPIMAAGVQPSIDIGCILSTAAGCLFKCGLDVPCLLACAPGLAKCL